MKTLKFLSLVVMLFIGVGSIQAQQKELTQDRMTTKSQAHTKDRTQKLQKELNLTPEQSEKIEEIRAKRTEEKMQLKKQLRELNEAERNEIQAVYTPEQKAKMKEMRKNRKKTMKAHPGKRDMHHKKMQNRKRR